MLHSYCYNDKKYVKMKEDSSSSADESHSAGWKL